MVKPKLRRTIFAIWWPCPKKASNLENVNKTDEGQLGPQEKKKRKEKKRKISILNCYFRFLFSNRRRRNESLTLRKWEPRHRNPKCLLYPFLYQEHRPELGGFFWGQRKKGPLANFYFYFWNFFSSFFLYFDQWQSHFKLEEYCYDMCNKKLKCSYKILVIWKSKRNFISVQYMLPLIYIQIQS